MECVACSEKSNYIFCEECLSWLTEGDVEMVEMDGSDEDA